MRLETDSLHIADEAVGTDLRPAQPLDRRQRNVLMLFPPDAQLPDGWQAPWIQAGWGVARCGTSGQIPAALHGPGASALVASPWAEIGKPSLSDKVSKGLASLAASIGPLPTPTAPVVPPSGGVVRRSDFMARLEHELAAPRAGCTALLSIHLDQAASLAQGLKRIEAFELEEALCKRIAAELDAADAMTIWLEFGFGVLVNRADADAVQALAERLRMVIAEAPVTCAGDAREVTVAIGMALSPPGAGQGDAQKWFSAAYAAQGIAKRHGGNGCAGLLTRAYEPMPAEQVLIVREWVEEAKSCTNVVVEFQPLLPMHGEAGERYSVHAKLRDLRDPLGGIYRRDYRRIALEAGAMVMIDRMALFHAFEVLQQEHERGMATGLVVPIELESLKDRAWRWLEAELRRRRHLIPRLTVEFEATPELLEQDSVKRIVRLRHLGVKVGICDRRRQLDQIELWARLPLDVLRLHYAAVSPFSAKQFQAIVHAWRAKGRQIVIDAVPSVEAVSRLADLGVDYLRGNALATVGPRLDYDFSTIA